MGEQRANPVRRTDPDILERLRRAVEIDLEVPHLEQPLSAQGQGAKTLNGPAIGEYRVDPVAPILAAVVLNTAIFQRVVIPVAIPVLVIVHLPPDPGIVLQVARVAQTREIPAVLHELALAVKDGGPAQCRRGHPPGIEITGEIPAAPGQVGKGVVNVRDA